MTAIGCIPLVIVTVGIGYIRATFESDCNVLAPPAYGIYDRGHCYVFVDTPEHGWSVVQLLCLQSGVFFRAEAQDVCTHLPGARSPTSVINGGLAMWLPPTILPIMNANPSKYATLLAVSYSMP